jgi:hypothetical protein
MQNIKAIDTPYNNHLFRSRLEARFAVFFDALGVEWTYEEEGFELGKGERYLPDFFLPKYDLYAEIKPKELSYKEHSKCKRLAVLSNCRVIELVGLPSTSMMDVIIPCRQFVCPTYGITDVYKDIRSEKCKCGAKHPIANSIVETKGALILKSAKSSYMPIFYGEYSNDDYSDKLIQDAIRKATQARFEFNY